MTEMLEAELSAPSPVVSLPLAETQPRWYAAYTLPHHEKSVAEQLRRKSVEEFLPLYASERRWKDRRVRLQLPLFPGYVFVRISLESRLPVLETPSVVRLVGFNGAPAAVPESEVEALRRALSMPLRAEPHPYLTSGRRVRIRSGVLQGVEGILVRQKSGFRVVLSVNLIQSSTSVEVDLADLDPLW